jgi:hypothetical protein
MAEWSSNHSFADRIANLSGTGCANLLNGNMASMVVSLSAC